MQKKEKSSTIKKKKRKGEETMRTAKEITEKKSWMQMGRYGRAREAFLQKENPKLYRQMLAEGVMLEYLTDTDKSAQQMRENIMRQKMKKEGVSEELKAQNPQEWTARMNQIMIEADSIVMREMILTL